MDPLSDMRANMALALSPLHGIAQNYRDRAAREREDTLLREERAFKREMLDAEISGRRSLVDAEIQGRKDVAGLEHDFRTGEAKKARKHDKNMLKLEANQRRKDRKQRLKDEEARRTEELRNHNRMQDDTALKKKGADVGLDPVYFTNEDGDFDRIAYADALGVEQIRKVQYLEEAKGRKLTELMSSDSGQRDASISPKIAELRREVVQQMAGKAEVFNILSDKLGEKQAYDLIDKLSKPLDEGGITLKTVQGMIIGKRGWLGQGDKYQKAARLDQIVSEEMSALAPSMLDAESKKLLQEDLRRKEILMKEILQYDNEVAGIRQAMGAAHAKILAQAEESMGNQPNSYQAMVAAINAENKTVAYDPDDDTDPEDPASTAPPPPENPNMPTPDGSAVEAARPIQTDDELEQEARAIETQQAEGKALGAERQAAVKIRVRKKEIEDEVRAIQEVIRNRFKVIDRPLSPESANKISRSLQPGQGNYVNGVRMEKRKLTNEELFELRHRLTRLKREVERLDAGEVPEDQPKGLGGLFGTGAMPTLDTSGSKNMGIPWKPTR